MRNAFLFLLLACACLPARAQEVPMLVTVDWLARHGTDPGVVVLQVGGEYEREHIPGARFLTLDDVSKPHVMDGEHLMLELPDAAHLRRTFEELGVSDDSHVVVYAGSSLQGATRVILTLDHLGLGARTSLLDGGLRAWKEAGRPVTAEAPPPRRGRLSERPTRNLVVDAEGVNRLRAQSGYTVIDARDRPFYTGERSGSGSQRAGHVAGAVNLPFSSVTDESGLLRSPEELRALFRDAGIDDGDTAVVYCHIGMQATAVIFAARLIGMPTLLYDGSFEEWSRLDGMPVESGRPR